MSEKVPSNVVVSKAGSPDTGLLRMFGNRWEILAGTVVLVLLLGAGGYYYFLKPSAKVPAHSATDSSPALPPIPVDYVQMNDDALANKVNYLMASHQYAAADKLISMQNDLNTSKNKLQLLATVQTKENKSSEAAKTEQKILALGDVAPGQYEVMGDRSAAAGDTAKAKEYYQKAITGYTARKTGPWQATVQSIQAKIKGLPS